MALNIPKVSPGAAVPPKNPALVIGGGASGAGLLVAVLALVGLPISLETAVAILAATSVAGPFLTTVLVRLNVFSPDTVQRIQQDFMAMAKDARATDPPAVVTNEPMTAVEASEAHPGTLGFAGVSEDVSDEHSGSQGRHERKGRRR